jgi:hypothetical protein
VVVVLLKSKEICFLQKSAMQEEAKPAAAQRLCQEMMVMMDPRVRFADLNFAIRIQHST